jgi:hypothetical protein
MHSGFWLEDCCSDGTFVITFANDTEFHGGQELNPTGSVPLRPQNTTHYPDGSTDNVTVVSREYFADYSCVTT